MNKLLIVGHPEAGYQEVESLLNACGMHPPHPSRREGLTAHEIGAILCKAHKAEPLQQLATDRAIAQIESSPVWHGMALDLMLGNIDQELWGWADPSAVYLLDYWKTLDQNITFILVYNSPETLLGSSRQNAVVSEEELQQRGHVWQSYNAALLHFYYRNRERCLLVHAEQVRHSANKYLQQVRARVNAPLVEPSELTELECGATRRHDVSINPVSAPPDSARTADNVQPGRATFLRDDEIALDRFLAQAVVNQQPQVLQLYAELQAAANLPFANNTNEGIHALQAWRALSAMHEMNSQLSARALQQHTEAEQVLIETNKQHEQENALVLMQLYQVQEELEQHHRETQKNKATIQALQDAEKLASERAEKLRQQLAEEAERATVAVGSSDIRQENELLLLQLHQVQEELERYYLENQRLKQTTAAPSPEKQPAGHYGAAERVKRQLSYRLGMIMMQNYRSVPGLICMPGALIREARQFRREKLNASNVKLPPLHIYRDAHEAEKVKRHLTYKLGATLIVHSKSPGGWIKLPFALRHEIKTFRRKRHQA